MFIRIARDSKLNPFFLDVHNDKHNFINYFTFICGGSKDNTPNPLLNHSSKLGELKKIDFDKIAGYMVNSLQELNVG